MEEEEEIELPDWIRLSPTEGGCRLIAERPDGRAYGVMLRLPTNMKQLDQAVLHLRRVTGRA